LILSGAGKRIAHEPPAVKPRDEGFGVAELEDVGEGISHHFRTVAQLMRTFKHSKFGD
jgi:hypothetical protein